MDRVIYKEKRFSWLTVLEIGKSKMNGPHLVRAILLFRNMVEGITWQGRLGEGESV